MIDMIKTLFLSVADRSSPSWQKKKLSRKDQNERDHEVECTACIDKGTGLQTDESGILSREEDDSVEPPGRHAVKKTFRTRLQTIVPRSGRSGRDSRPACSGNRAENCVRPKLCLFNTRISQCTFSSYILSMLIYKTIEQVHSITTGVYSVISPSDVATCYLVYTIIKYYFTFIIIILNTLHRYY